MKPIELYTTAGCPYSEAAREDRIAGMAASQATIVHEGVAYDLEVDTTSTAPIECARVIAACVT